MGKGQDLYIKAKKIIPGGTQLLSKRPEMFLPDQWPSYYAKSKGCVVTDLDGNEYYDVSYMGIGACVLGYAFDPVDKAAKEAIEKGGMCTLNAPEEVSVAEKLLELHPWADMVRYGKAGGEAMAIATRIARTSTNKDIVLICGYHGWQDWYLATNLGDKSALNPHHLSGLEPRGVPRELKGTTLPFLYNDWEGFLALAAKYEGQIAAVVMEPIRNDYPIDGFLQKIRYYTEQNGIVLVFDEITAGFRLTCGGSHLALGVNPDIAVFAKGMGNGYPLSAIIGRSSIMTAAQETFISSTFWTERVGLCGALASITYFQEHEVEKHLESVGKRVQEIWKAASEKHALPIEIEGILPLSHFSFVGKEPLLMKTYFIQLMLERGFLASTALYASLAHTDDILDQYEQAIMEVFGIIKDAMIAENIKEKLKGPICHAGFQRLN
jgi:glutamate-1-semialdehyde aminotransferase